MKYKTKAEQKKENTSKKPDKEKRKSEEIDKVPKQEKRTLYSEKNQSVR